MQDPWKIIEELRRENERLRARIAELEEQLRANSQNSSKPPSTDPIGIRRPRKPKSSRRPGGQPGHPGAHRELLPPERVSRVRNRRPPNCCHCGEPLRGDDPNPSIHQVVELPPVEPDVTEYRIHSLTCPRCGVRTSGELPSGVPSTCFGPRLTAVIALLTGVYHLSRRDARELVADLLHVDLSVGSVVAAESRISAALASPIEAAREYVASQAAVHADETGWREAGERVWLWVAATTLVTVFLIRASRGAKAARELLRGFAGVLVSDRWSAYNDHPLSKRQFCWAHLRREFVKFFDRGGMSRRVGRCLLRRLERLSECFHRARDGTLSLRAFRKRIAKIRKATHRDLVRGSMCGHPRTESTCRELLGKFAALWTFADHEGIDLTNNLAERALRSAVLWRKKSFGTQSEAGSGFVERILSARMTLRQQGRNVLQFLTETYQAELSGHSGPSLLPSPVAMG